MKKNLNLVTISILVGLFLQVAQCVSVTIEWRYGHAARKSYLAQYKDEWNGMNYWCINTGNQCGEWDWKVEYPVTQQNPRPLYACTPEYGHGLVIQAAANMQIELPPDLGLPVYTEY